MKHDPTLDGHFQPWQEPSNLNCCFDLDKDSALKNVSFGIIILHLFW